MVADKAIFHQQSFVSVETRSPNRNSLFSKASEQSADFQCNLRLPTSKTKTEDKLTRNETSRDSAANISSGAPEAKTFEQPQIPNTKRGVPCEEELDYFQDSLSHFADEQDDVQ